MNYKEHTKTMLYNTIGAIETMLIYEIEYMKILKTEPFIYINKQHKKVEKIQEIKNQLYMIERQLNNIE